MNTLRLLALVAVVGSLHPAVAETVNQCRDDRGRPLITDRPCGDPSAERSRGLQAPQIVVQQIQTEDIFLAREKIRRNGLSISAEMVNSVDSRQDAQLPGN